MFSKKDFTNVEGIMMLQAIRMHSSKRNAAKYLNISLDTLDKYINMLEQELGVKLITTNGRGCTLTVHGEKVVKNTEQIKQCLENAYLVTASETDIKGEVMVAYDQSVRWNLYAHKISTLTSQYPGITLCIDNFNGTPNMSDLQYDISVSYEVPKGEDLVVIYSKEIPCRFFASTDYLAHHEYPQNIDDLLENHRLIIKKNSSVSNSEAYKKMLKGKQNMLLTNSSFVTSDLVANGAGVGLLPAYLATTKHGFVCLDNLDSDAFVTIHLISHRSRKDIPKIRVVLDYYKKLLQSL